MYGEGLRGQIEVWGGGGGEEGGEASQKFLPTLERQSLVKN